MGSALGIPMNFLTKLSSPLPLKSTVMQSRNSLIILTESGVSKPFETKMLKSPCLCFEPNVARKFDKYCRLVVRVRNPLTSLSFGKKRDLTRSNVDSFYLSSLRNVIVLAVLAKPIAARGCYRENSRSGMVVSYWLFLNWVDVTCEELAVGKKLKLSSYVLPDSAESYLSFSELAIPCTSGTLHFAALDWDVKLCLLQVSHRSIYS